MNRREKVSIVLSAYNEEDNIRIIYEDITNHLKAFNISNYEIIVVNDGSTDKTLENAEEIMKKDDKLFIVNLLRNFGHEIAMSAGMDYASGDCVIFMDSDLQHPPEYINKMIKLWQSGKDVVLTRRNVKYKKPLLYKMLSRLFYFVLNWLSDIKIDKNFPDFRLIDKEYIEHLKKMKENERMFRGMLNWVGMKNIAIIDVDCNERLHGKTKYNFFSSLKLAVNSIVQFSIKPLRVATFVGVATAFFAVIFGLYSVAEYYIYDKPQSGYTSIIVIFVLVSSIQLLAIGIIGEYIGRIHIETKNRPLYFAEILRKKNKDEK